MVQNLQLFHLTDQIQKELLTNKIIPADFYSVDGQILIYKKINATNSEINRLLNFAKRGLYFKSNEANTLNFNSSQEEGYERIYTKLITLQFVEILMKLADLVVEAATNGEIKITLIDRCASVFKKIFNNFKSKPNAMMGLINIFELLTNQIDIYQKELMVKRVIIAMVLRTRILMANSTVLDEHKVEGVVHLMLAAFLCDISYLKLKLPTNKNINLQEYQKFHVHPIISCLMLAHLSQNIHLDVKKLILFHHHPFTSIEYNNNFPTISVMSEKLLSYSKTHTINESNKDLIQGLEELKINIEVNTSLNEQYSILTIASAFASLTSNVPWRKLYSPKRALQILINEGLFSYSPFTLREFIDHCSMSLNNNIPIIKEGMFLIIAVRNMNIKTDNITQFEVGYVEHINPSLLSRPQIMRLGTISPIIGRVPQIKIANLNLDSFRSDHRRARFELELDPSRQIAYIIDPDYNLSEYNFFKNLN